jgi:hypothetical protein
MRQEVKSMPEPVAKRRPMIDLEQFERRLRQPNVVNRADEDPLAELARLVGQEDPYKSVFEPQPQHSAQGEQDPADHYAAGAWEEPERSDVNAQERFINGDFAAIEAGLLGAGGRHTAEDEVEDLGSFDTDDVENWRYEDEAAVEPRGGRADAVRSSRPLYLMAAIIIIGIAGIGASFALKGAVSGPREIATIKAATGPAKVQPETTTNADVPNQDASILNRSPQPQPVALADNAEQPVDLSQMPEKTPRVIALSGLKAGVASGAANVPVPPSPTQAQAAPPSQGDTLSIANLIEPKKVKTISVRPDGTLVSNERAPSPQMPISASPLVAPRAATPGAKAATPKTTARVATTPKPGATGSDVARQSAAAKPVQVADAQTGTAPSASGQTGGGAFAVQLAAPASEQEARDIQLRLIKKYGAEISGFHPSIRKAVSGDKTVYRVRSVGLSKEEATALCQKVQSSGGNCFVARN